MAMPVRKSEYRNPRIEVLGLAKAARSYAIDLAYTIHFVDGRVAALWLFEIDLSRTRIKYRRWSLYLGAFENEFDVDGKLAIFAPRPKIRRWLRERLVPKSRVDPIIVEPDHIVRITDYDEARRTPELAILSCIFHAHDPAPEENQIEVVCAAWIALQVLPPKHSLRYGGMVMDIIGKPIVEKGLERLRKAGHLDESDIEMWAESVRGGYSYTLGHDEGHAEARRELLREAIVDLLEARGFALTPSQRERIAACESLETLARRRAAAKTEGPEKVLAID